jgi:hypothetical protein
MCKTYKEQIDTYIAVLSKIRRNEKAIYNRHYRHEILGINGEVTVGEHGDYLTLQEALDGEKGNLSLYKGKLLITLKGKQTELKASVLVSGFNSTPTEYVSIQSWGGHR